MLLRKISFIFFSVFCVLVGLYPAIYFLIDGPIGLLEKKSQELLSNAIWNFGFYTHILFGGLALFIGWIQFSEKIRNRYIVFHRTIGKTYVIAVLLSSISAIYISFYATGGIIPALGFGCLALVWLFTTVRGFLLIRGGDIPEHRKMLIYSYAACFAAVTLRIWLPILTILTADFLIAYKIVSWLCWVPNIGVAYFLVHKSGNDSLAKAE